LDRTDHRDVPHLIEIAENKPGTNAMKSTKLWRRGVLSVFTAIPAGGFLFGVLHPGDPDPNPIGRIVYAFMMAVQTPLHAGFPLHHDGISLHPYNAWPHIAVAWILIFSACTYRNWKRHAVKSN
jgi:Trk-type K+ transport system membrane component